MREDEALFTLYKGRWKTKLVPRGAAGRWATIWSLLPVFLATGGLVWIMASHPGRGTAVAALVAYVMLVLGWSFGFYQWGKARSVVIDLTGLSRVDALRVMLGKQDKPQDGA